MSSLIIVGAGGFGLEVAAYAKDCFEAGLLIHEPKGFLDDTKQAGTLHGGLPILGNSDSKIDAESFYLVAIGDPSSRRLLTEKITARGARFATLLHPAAYIADTAKTGEGTVMAPFSFAGPESQVGKHVLVNIYASVAHESLIGDFVTLSPYAGTHASSVINDGVFLGAHSTVTNGVKIGKHAKLASGAVAYNDVLEYASAIGNPARFKKEV